MTNGVLHVQKTGSSLPKTLGQILWFSIAASTERDAEGNRINKPVLVAYPDLERWFDELGLNPTFLPTKIAAVNAFRSASSKIGAEYDLPVHGQRVKLVISEVLADNEHIVRHILREHIDTRKGKTQQDKVGELRFSRGRRSNAGRVAGSERCYHVISNKVTGDERAIIDEQIAQFYQRYETQTIYRDDNDVRTILREYLRSLDAIAIEPSKGIYFVTDEASSTVQMLGELVRHVGPGCSLHTFPLIDSIEQRELLFESFREQLEDEVRVLMRDLDRYTEQIKGGPAAPQKFGEFNARWDRLIARRNETCGTLGLGRECVDEALEDARIAIAELAKRVGLRRRR